MVIVCAGEQEQQKRKRERTIRRYYYDIRDGLYISMISGSDGKEEERKSYLCHANDRGYAKPRKRLLSTVNVDTSWQVAEQKHRAVNQVDSVEVPSLLLLGVNKQDTENHFFQQNGNLNPVHSLQTNDQD